MGEDGLKRIYIYILRKIYSVECCEEMWIIIVMKCYRSKKALEYAMSEFGVSVMNSNGRMF